jgi:hypothetical protein
MKLMVELEGTGFPPPSSFDGLEFEQRNIKEKRDGKPDGGFSFVGYVVISLGSAASGVIGNYIFAWLRSPGAKVMSLKIEGERINPDDVDAIADAVKKRLTQ